MNFKNYNTQQIDQHLKILVNNERKLLHDILLTVKEIDQRRIFERMGYSSLFLYLTEEIGYSNGSAQRRIDGAQLLKEVPEVGEKIKSGEIKLNQITLVQEASRQVFRNTAHQVSAAEKAEILEQICSTQIKESEQQVAAFFELPVLEKTKIKVQADGSWLVTMRIPKELVEDIEYAQALVSHAVPTKELIPYFEYVTKRLIKQKTSVRQAKPENEIPRGSESREVQDKDKDTKSDDAEDNATKPNADSTDEGFSQRQRKILMQEQKICQHVDPVSKKQCPNKWFLQADHRQSRWAGGQAKIENGQMLCAAHNQAKYRKEAGIHTGH